MVIPLIEGNWFVQTEQEAVLGQLLGILVLRTVKSPPPPPEIRVQSNLEIENLFIKLLLWLLFGEHRWPVRDWTGLSNRNFMFCLETLPVAVQRSPWLRLRAIAD